MTPFEKLETLRKKVASLANQGELKAAKNCIELWEDIVCPELSADNLGSIQPQLHALKAFVGSAH